MKITPDKYLNVISDLFQSNANPDKAGKMTSYMRNLFPFLGISSPERNRLQRQVYAEYGKPDSSETEYIAGELWRMDAREFQYFAMDITDRNIKKQPPATIKFLEELIREKSWWDTVDFLAVNPAGKFFQVYPESIIPVTSRWMDSGNMWLQRSCLLFQLKYKHNTDSGLLYSLINRMKSSNEFFIRKAIGWALREYSKTNPYEVERFINSNELKPLSRKEALKVIERKKNHGGNQ